TRSQFRRAINLYIQPEVRPENLPEILVNINIDGPDLAMSGGGWGHGVGMSQYGAKGMAEKGITYTKILSNYYVGTNLTTIYCFEETMKTKLKIAITWIVLVAAAAAARQSTAQGEVNFFENYLEVEGLGVPQAGLPAGSPQNYTTAVTAARYDANR